MEIVVRESEKILRTKNSRKEQNNWGNRVRISGVTSEIVWGTVGISKAGLRKADKSVSGEAITVLLRPGFVRKLEKEVLVVVEFDVWFEEV